MSESQPSEPRETWDEDASETYRQIAAIAVPDRLVQVATLLTLVPYGPDEAFRAVELGSGEGRLAQALLDAYPEATITALDGSASMREETARRLERFGSRFEVAPFDLLRDEWLHHLDGAGVVLSSLVVHHLDDAGKQWLFRECGGRLDLRGALLIADLVDPARAEVTELFAETYERAAERQSYEVTGSDAYYQAFLTEKWNHFRYPDLEVDRPSRLFDQLVWLREAGFQVVDCFWLQAGHAIYGGYRQTARQAGELLPYARALEAAGRALGTG